MKHTGSYSYRFICCLLACGKILSCTPYTSGSSPNGASPKRQGERSTAQVMESRQVVALTGQWSSALPALAEPQVTTEPGYDRVEAWFGGKRALNCFVYQVPIDAGQAVTRLLRAIGVGIEFEKIEPRSVELVGETPLVQISGKYKESDTGRPGLFKLALASRTRFPVVCTHDEIGFEKEFEDIVRGFVQQFSPASPISEDAPELMSEVWKLKDNLGTLGFSTFRVYRGAEGETVSLEVSTTYASLGNRLRTTDSVTLESEDAQGLKSGKWLDIVDTRSLLQIALERRPNENGHYRYIGEVDGRSVAGDFDSTIRLSSSGTANREISRFAEGEPDPDQELSLLRYQPAHSLEAPTQVFFRSTRNDKILRMERGGSVSELELGADWLPTGFRAGPKEQEAFLMKRRVNPAAIDGNEP